MMLYDNIYYLGHIFQMFLQDASETRDYGRDLLSCDDASCTGTDVTLGSHLLEWLDRQNIVLDITHKAALLQMANTGAALTSLYADFQPLTMSS
jgi:hypothetical protein